MFREVYELDELYWYVERKADTETRENVYVITMVSREPRQIVGYDVARDKSSRRIQSIINSAPAAYRYHTDGYVVYADVEYPGCHIRNARDRSDTYIVEGVNADLRHYIPVLARRSRCFCRSIDTLQAVISVFVDAYTTSNYKRPKQPISMRNGHDAARVTEQGEDRIAESVHYLIE